MKKDASPPSSRPSSPSTEEPPTLEPAVDPRAPARKIHRRGAVGFLAGLSASLPLAASFSWLSPRRGPAPPAAPAMTPSLRPRLMVIVPADTKQQTQLGHGLGEYLNHGSDKALAPLAAVDLSCIADGEIELPATAMGQGPLALLLIAGDTQRLVRFALPSVDAVRREYERRIARFELSSAEILDHENDPSDTRWIDERIAIVSSAVARAVLDGDQVVGLSQRMLAHERVQEIATRASAGHAVADWRTHDGLYNSRYPRNGDDQVGPQVRALLLDEAVDLAPALLAVALHVTGKGHTSLMSTLAAVARRRVVRSEVPGAEWATESNCGGIEIENRERLGGVSCGLGHVPERSERFLYFYTQKPSDR